MNYKVLENFPALGKEVAFSFLDWAQKNPEGVASLPTGKTPEYFIKWVKNILADWNSKPVQKMLGEAGLKKDSKPDMRGLRFVQMDEFYPIDPEQHNSFCYYVRNFYIDGFGLDPGKAMVIDCSKLGLRENQTLEQVWPDSRVDLDLRHRAPQSQLEEEQKAVIHRIDQWCQEYEDRIRAMGGIGFFLGGIGPDGHIAFNIRGTDHYSTTRLAPINYETQAAAAGDLGGMEIARNRLVITIGLETITCNPDCRAIVMAAGEAKAGVVADAVESSTDALYPATALRKLPEAIFYLTKGAASEISEVRREVLSSGHPDQESVRRVIIDVALASNKRVTDITRDDLAADPVGAELLRVPDVDLEDEKTKAYQHLVAAVEKGMFPVQNRRFLHTEPHHDDIMLGYLPAVVRNIREATNRHYFMTLTSGFTSVTNHYMQRQLSNLDSFLQSDDFRLLEDEDYFNPESQENRNRDVWQYLDGVAAGEDRMCAEGAARRLFRNLKEIYSDQSQSAIHEELQVLLEYLAVAYPGKKDTVAMQKLKGMCREWEAECLWGYFGWQCANVTHERLGFYTGDIFTGEPDRQRDVEPILKKMRELNPDVISVALDPEGSGPDTHYKVMQAIHTAIDEYEPDAKDSGLRIWGYRNVWYRFHPAEMNMCVPVSLNMFAIMHNAFMNTFISQREASFPSYQYDGPFSKLAQKIQVEQYHMLKTCLGREWFHDHPNAMIRATRGLVFMKEMNAQGFYEHSRKLRQAAEDL